MGQENESIQNIPISLIVPNQFQPRLNFDEKALEDLAASIKQHGIIQPLVLRKINNKYEIIAGERRYRAACLVGLETVPAIIKQMDDNASAEVALIENIQRKNLTPIEEAKSYKNILDKGFLTQEELANKLGLSQSAVSNKMRLLNLSENVQEALLSGKISERHARSLLNLNKEDQTSWLDRIINERMTVRQLDLELKNKLNIESTDNEAPKSEENASNSMNFSQLFTPNIDEIVSNAKDIIPREEPKETVDLLKPSEMQSLAESKISEEAPQKVIPNKFFNYLEDDEANLNTTEISPPLTIVHNDLETNDNEIKSNEKVVEENKEIALNNNVKSQNLNIEFESNEDLSFFKDESSPNLEIDNNIYEQKGDSKSINEFVDPLDLIETLSPDYEIKQQEERGLDLKTAINSIRSNTSNLIDKGFLMEIEELDLPEIYEITIKIKKQ